VKRELRPHQAKAIEMLRASLASGKRRPVLQAPTGMGKTVLAAAIIESAVVKNKRVIFTVPALSLVDQTVRAFWDEGLRELGVIQGIAGSDAARAIGVRGSSVTARFRRKDAHSYSLGT
jgi:superfamily II DNA or RNA helicase